MKLWTIPSLWPCLWRTIRQNLKENIRPTKYCVDVVNVSNILYFSFCHQTPWNDELVCFLSRCYYQGVCFAKISLFIFFILFFKIYTVVSSHCEFKCLILDKLKQLEIVVRAYCIWKCGTKLEHCTENVFSAHVHILILKCRLIAA